MGINLGITVNELFEFWKKKKKKGNGEKHVLISSDDEGNNFHTLFYGFTDEPEEVQYLLEYEQDGTHTVDNCVVLG